MRNQDAMVPRAPAPGTAMLMEYESLTDIPASWKNVGAQPIMLEPQTAWMSQVMLAISVLVLSTPLKIGLYSLKAPAKPDFFSVTFVFLSCSSWCCMKAHFSSARSGEPFLTNF